MLANRPPGRVLVVGVERSGTTWVAHALASGPDARYVHEPDNLAADPGAALGKRRLGEYPALPLDARAPRYSQMWHRAFSGGWPHVPGARVLGRAVQRTPGLLRDPLVAAVTPALTVCRRPPATTVVKSVHAPFSLEWVAARFAHRVVVVRRNPLQVVSSLIRLGTTLDHLTRLEELYAHPAVRRQFVEPLALPEPPPTGSLVTRTAWWVGVTASVYAATARRHPDWVVVTHDRLCADPQVGFRRLFDAVGLPWSDEAEAHVRETDRRRGGRTASWSGSPDVPARSLTADEVAEASEALAHFPLLRQPVRVVPVPAVALPWAG